MLFSKISTRMGGGRIKLALSANAPLSPLVLNFLEVYVLSLLRYLGDS